MVWQESETLASYKHDELLAIRKQASSEPCRESSHGQKNVLSHA